MSDQDELRELTRPGRGPASRGACRQRRRSRPCPRGTVSARDSGRLYRAPHRTGPGARVDGPPARRRARHLRRRALADHVDGPGGARRLDADGQAARCARRRGEAGARDPRDRGQGRERRRVHVGRRRLQTGHRDVGRGDGGAAARPASPRRRRASPSSSRRRRRRATGLREEEDIEVSWERIWNIEPILFDSALIDLCDEACRRSPAPRTGFRQGRCTTRPRWREPAFRP